MAGYQQRHAAREAKRQRVRAERTQQARQEKEQARRQYVAMKRELQAAAQAAEEQQERVFGALTCGVLGGFSWVFVGFRGVRRGFSWFWHGVRHGFEFSSEDEAGQVSPEKADEYVMKQMSAEEKVRLKKLEQAVSAFQEKQTWLGRASNRLRMAIMGSIWVFRVLWT